MFSGFNLTISPDFFGYDYEELSKFRGLNTLEEDVNSSIHELICNDYLSASQIKEEWFPDVKADVFISHSHNDEGLANALAGWLFENFEIKAFVDSHFWNYAGDLLKEINDEFSERSDTANGNILYNYNKCNNASEHVNIMLNAALQKMIDKTETVFFLNTDNSIRVFNHSDSEMSATYSPWIFSEILCTQIVRKKPLCEYRLSPVLEHASDEMLQIPYEVSLSHFEDISEETLNDWLYIYNSKKIRHPLDELYSLSSNYSEELRNTREIIAAKRDRNKSKFLMY